MTNEEIKALVENHKVVKDLLDSYKKEEMMIRQQLAAEFLPSDGFAGTIKKPEFGLSIAYKNNVTVDRDVDFTIINQLPIRIQECFIPKFTLSLTKYKGLVTEDQDIVDAYVTEKPATPTLKISN